MKGSQASMIRFGVFEVDLGAGELHRHGLKIHLPDQPFQVLAMLLKHPGGVVTREELRQRLWGSDTFVDFDNSLNAAVNKLREALGDSAENPRFIETLPRRGYRFIAPVETPKGAARSRMSRWVLYAGMGAAVLLAILVGLNVRGWRERLLAHGAAPQIRSVAVLPLANLSRDPEQEYFADGMTDALIANLAKISALRVISRTSVMQYKGTKKLLPQIAKELNVDAVVEGSVARSGDRVRIIAQLIDASADKHLWAEAYERDLRDVLILQSDVARAIAEEIKVKLTPEERTRFAKVQPSVNPQAYEAYLRGSAEWLKLTEEGVRKSTDYFEQAIRTDPNYAHAYFGLCTSYAVLGQQELIPPREAYAKARAAILRALELDDSLADAHACLGWIHRNYDWDWLAAEREFKRALALDPNSARVRHGYSALLATVDRTEESLAEEKRAQELDPLSPFYYAQLGLALIHAKHYSAALAECGKALEFDPAHARGHFCIGQAYAEQGKYEQAIAEMRKALELPGGRLDVVARLAQVYVLAGRKPEAVKLFSNVKALAKQRNVSPLDIARFHAILGHKDEAFRWLESAYLERAPFLTDIKGDSTFAELQSDPRFAELLRRIGLPP